MSKPEETRRHRDEHHRHRTNVEKHRQRATVKFGEPPIAKSEGRDYTHYKLHPEQAEHLLDIIRSPDRTTALQRYVDWLVDAARVLQEEGKAKQSTIFLEQAGYIEARMVSKDRLTPEQQAKVSRHAAGREYFERDLHYLINHNRSGKESHTGMISASQLLTGQPYFTLTGCADDASARVRLEVLTNNCDLTTAVILAANIRPHVKVVYENDAGINAQKASVEPADDHSQQPAYKFALQHLGETDSKYFSMQRRKDLAQQIGTAALDAGLWRVVGKANQVSEALETGHGHTPGGAHAR